jgi:transcriptional regulator with XRE-family HTH domain
MSEPHWPQITRQLVESGITQPELAKACGCSQSTVSDVIRGRTKDPRASIALALLRLAKERGIEVGAPAIPNHKPEVARAA